MFENEDVILPDDFTEDLPQSEEIMEETPVSEEVDTLETEQTEEQAEEARQEAIQALKVKYNKEEMEIPFDEAIPLVQKGLNYDKTLERLQALESDPRLSFVEELAREQGMEVNDYLEAVKQFKEQERINELVSKGISEDVAHEMLENRKFREQFEAEKKAKAEEEKKNAEYNEFFSTFREATGKDFVPGQDEIPAEVWEAHSNGTPLKYAFMEHQFKQLQSKVKVLQQNKQNEQKAPVGSLSAHGSQSVESEDEFLKGFNSI
jgi:hypothetical protein